MPRLQKCVWRWRQEQQKNEVFGMLKKVFVKAVVLDE